MKFYKFFLVTPWLFFACNNPAYNNENKIDTSYSSDVSIEERNRQIDNAKYNRQLLPGRWRFEKIISPDERFIKIEAINSNYDEIFFSKADSFIVFEKNKIRDKGSFEWMANDRELVFTSKKDSKVRRMLLKNVDSNYMDVKFKGNYVRFKKVQPKNNIK